MRISDSELIRLQVVKAIRRAEPVARTDLVALTGLSTGTVSQVTGDFVRRGIVVEERASGRALGRPRIELRINAAAGYVLTVFHRGFDWVDIEIVDMRGDAVFTYRTPVARAETLADRAGQLSRIVNDAIAASPVSKAQILKVGVVIHGVVDHQRGAILWLHSFTETEVPFAALLGEHLQLPVVIDNDTNVIARAVHWFGEGRAFDDFGVIVVDASVTIGYYVDGMLWSGPNGLNPELGHIKIGGGEPQPCFCGMSGCLATYSSIFGIVGRIRARRGLDRAGAEDMSAAFRAFLAEALAGEPVARDVFDLAGRVLGTAVANLLHERDPGRILIMVFNDDLAALIKDEFAAALQANTLPVVLSRAKVDFRTIDADYYLKGSAALALEDIFLG